MTRLTAGLAWYIASQFCSLLDGAMAHYLGPRGMSVGQIAFVNALATLALVAALSWRRPLFRTDHLALQLARGVLAFAAIWLMIYTLTHLPFADASALVRSRPIWMIVLSAILLGEAISAPRWIATAIGIVGALITIQPTFRSWTPDYLVGIAGVLASASVVVASRYVAKFDRTETTLAYGAVVTLAISAPLAIGPAPWSLWPAMVLLATANALALYTTQAAVRLADVSLLAPYDNIRLPIAMLVGIVAFQELPSLTTLTGATVIVMATVLLYLAERHTRPEQKRRFSG